MYTSWSGNLKGLSDGLFGLKMPSKASNIRSTTSRSCCLLRIHRERSILRVVSHLLRARRDLLRDLTLNPKASPTFNKLNPIPTTNFTQIPANTTPTIPCCCPRSSASLPTWTSTTRAHWSTSISRNRGFLPTHQNSYSCLGVRCSHPTFSWLVRE